MKTLDDINEIRVRLQRAYGDPVVMLRMKLSDLSKSESRHRDGEACKNALMNLIDSVTDLLKLTTEHCIQEKLYHGEALDTIYLPMGDYLFNRWFSKTTDEVMGEEVRWERLTKFLERELRIQEQKLLVKMDTGSLQPQDRRSSNANTTYVVPANNNAHGSLLCHFCGEAGHVPTNGPNNTLLIQYFACQKFAESNCSVRLRELRSKELCIQCLFPGAKQAEGRHANGLCQSLFTCKHSSHDKYPVKKHVLVCHEHSHTVENRTLLQDFIKKCIARSKAPLQDFSKNIKVSFHVLAYSVLPVENPLAPLPSDDEHVKEEGLYMFQPMQVNQTPGVPPSDTDEQVLITLFFDGGCNSFVSSIDGVNKIGQRAILEKEGPTELGGVNDTVSTSPHGEYQVRLPLHNGKDAVFSGVCLDKITVTFPKFYLHGKVKSDIEKACRDASFPAEGIPSYPQYVGGDVHFMIGIKYRKYFPVHVFTLPSGFQVCESPFVSADGSRGVLCGPHSVVTAMYKSFNCSMLQRSYLSHQMQLYRMGYQVNPDCAFLRPPSGTPSDRDEADDVHNDTSYAAIVKKQNQFEDVESAGSLITYRCVKCRKCAECRCSERIELVSIREEIEQDIIENSVAIEDGAAVASLPIIKDPLTYLAPNKGAALSVYNSVVRNLNKKGKESHKMAVIKSEAKLQEMGFVDYVRNLSAAQQAMLADNPIQNFFPWHVVENENSVTTPTRLVFNGTLPTPSSYCLNDILAKGHNSLNKLVEIFIRWFFNVFAFHCDVAKAYNSVKLREEFWCFQRYIFQKDLDPNCIPEEKVIKTLIYGAKSSGNQTESAIRKTAKLSQLEFPRVCNIIHDDMYMDDCMSGENTQESVYQRTDELDLVMKRGGFNLKGFTISGLPPLESLSATGDSIMVAGMKWFPENDILAFNIGDLQFSSKRHGKKTEPNKIPTKLTRRQCVSKVAEMFDLNGRITPIVAEMKLDLRALIKPLKLDWDDIIPDNIREIWLRHFGTMEEIRDLRYKRCKIPVDAVNLDIETVDTGDASKELACSAIYARILRRTGDFSCQLVFARSKLLPEDMTQPRGELFAAVMNAHTGEVVKRALGEKHKACVKLTDSQIVLHWLNNPEIPLKLWLRNRVVEALRLADKAKWYYVDGHNMVADIGTRRGSTLDDVKDGSVWATGYDWMKKPQSEFPIKTYQQVKDSLVQPAEAEKEVMFGDVYQRNVSNQAHLITPQTCMNEVKKRYEFSNYIYDPNKHSFSKSCMVVALIYRFISQCRNKVRTKLNRPTPVLPSKIYTSDIMLTDEELKQAESYYLRVATNELKKFNKPSAYEKISTEEKGMMIYTGRILPSQQIDSIDPLPEVMKDLTATTFCVPVTDKFSPVALGVVNDTHWNHPVAKHAGVETVLRYVMLTCYIIDGREIVRMIGKGCQRCRYLRMRVMTVSMGPVSNHLTIAPPFYVCQVDLAGPFNSYSQHNSRTKTKIWFAVFCCVSTSTVGIRVMGDSTTGAFVAAFVRQSCEVGFPKVMLTDLGSQLVSAATTTTFSFSDIKNRLYTERKVELETCPVGGHNMHGKVERKIRHIRESLQKNLHNEKLSELQWETLAAEVTNAINDMPIGYNNYSSDLESLDLLTPNRLKLGRNNNRSPVGPLYVTGKCDRFIRDNERIFNSWFNSWLISYVPSLMRQQKWFTDDKMLAVGDIVVFHKKEGELNLTYQYGIVESVEVGKDQKIRAVEVRYRNHNEGNKTIRFTNRAVRELVLIHHVDEVDVISELGVVASAVDAMKRLEVDSS